MKRNEDKKFYQVRFELPMPCSAIVQAKSEDEAKDMVFGRDWGELRELGLNPSTIYRNVGRFTDERINGISGVLPAIGKPRC